MRDRISGSIRRAHTSELANTTIDVYEPTESYTAGEAYDVSYPDSPTQTGIDARAEEPADTSADTAREEGGTTSDHDRIYRVRDDARNQWTGFGESGEASTRIEDQHTGQMWTVQSVIDERNGLIRLGCVEVA